MENETVHQDLKAAEHALSTGQYATAEHLLDKAARDGATPKHVADLGRKVRAAKRFHENRVRGSVWMGFFIAALGYLVLCAKQPWGWTIPVWLALSLLIVPGIAGLFVGRRHAGERTAFRAFMDGAKAGMYSMGCYSAFNLAVLDSHLQKEASQIGDEFFAAVATVVVLSLTAGLAAGLASALASRSTPKGETA